MKRRKGHYSISVVAKMFSVHQQTVRMYEKEGLITPKRSTGNTRLFSEEDVDRLEEIINLTHKMGVNLAGVEVILKLQKKIRKMQDEMNGLFNNMHGQLEDESETCKEEAKKQVERLVDMKRSVGLAEKKMTQDPVVDVAQNLSFNVAKKKKETVARESEREDDWKIEYEDK